MPETDKEIFLRYIWSLIGKPYIWGGDDAVAGFDCSGLVIEGLKAIGKLPENYDNTAKGLYIKFAEYLVDKPYEGCLVFYGESLDSIKHIEVCISSTISIGASGGGSKVKNMDDAIYYNAFIKPRPIERGRTIFGYIDPFSREL